MNRLLFALQTVLFVTICQASSKGDDGKSPSAVRFDERAFAQLPIRFNGRVTDFDHYARNTMLRISGRETWQGKDGKPQPATAWLLDLMTGSDVAESVPVLLVEDPQVRELLKLDPGAADRRISIQDLLTRLLPFMERVDDVNRSHSRPTDDERAVLKFSLRLDFLSRTLGAFRRPDLSSKESLMASAQQAAASERQAIPFVAPPKQPGGSWGTLTSAMIMAHVARQSDGNVDPAGVLYTKLIEARRKGDASTFNRAVQELATLIRDQKLAACPLDFIVPRGWIEEGTPRLDKQHDFADAGAFGTTVSTLNLFDGIDHLMMHINFFPQGMARKEMIVNNWRKLEGRAPLTLEKVRTNPVQVAGQTGWRIDIESPDDLPVKSERMLAVGFSQGTHGYIVVCSGPKLLMSKHTKDFDQFVTSIRIESPAAIEKWISLPKPESPPQSKSGTKAVLAMIPDKQDVWLIQGEYSDQENSDEKIATLKLILQSIQFRPKGKGTEPSDLLPFEWTLPEDWQLEEFPDGQLWVVSRTPPAFVALTVQPLKTEEGWSRPVLINQWRTKFELPDLTPEKINDITETLIVDNRKITLVVVDVP